MNQAKIAKQNNDMLGVKAAGRDAVNELGVQAHKSNQTQANAINKAEAQLNDAYVMYYNMLSTQQLDKLYENMKQGHEAGNVPLEQLTRIEGVLLGSVPFTMSVSVPLIMSPSLRCASLIHACFSLPFSSAR